MKKILFVVTTLEAGGVENYLLRFLKYSSGKINPVVLCKGGYGGSMEMQYRNIGVSVNIMKLGYFSLADTINIYQYLKNEGYDAICDFTGDFSGLMLWIANNARVKNRLVFYRGSRYQFKPTIVKITYAKVLNLLVKKYATKILSNSKEGLNYFHYGWEKDRKKYGIIRNGIPHFNEISHKEKKELRKRLGISQEAFVIGHLGSYRQAKNHEIILKVADVMIKKYDNVYFFLAGHGVKYALNTKVERMEKSDRIILNNARTDIWELLQIFDAFFFPSLNEGQPNALLEAMSVGLPFVASDIAPIQESIPVFTLPYLVNPVDIKKSVILLSALVERKLEFPSAKLKAWTKKQYDVDKLFGQFLKYL